MCTDKTKTEDLIKYTFEEIKKRRIKKKILDKRDLCYYEVVREQMKIKDRINDKAIDTLLLATNKNSEYIGEIEKAISLMADILTSSLKAHADGKRNFMYCWEEDGIKWLRKHRKNKRFDYVVCLWLFDKYIREEGEKTHDGKTIKR